MTYSRAALLVSRSVLELNLCFFFHKLQNEANEKFCDKEIEVPALLFAASLPSAIFNVVGVFLIDDHEIHTQKIFENVNLLQQSRNSSILTGNILTVVRPFAAHYWRW